MQWKQVYRRRRINAEAKDLWRAMHEEDQRGQQYQMVSNLLPVELGLWGGSRAWEEVRTRIPRKPKT